MTPPSPLAHLGVTGPQRLALRTLLQAPDTTASSHEIANVTRFLATFARELVHEREGLVADNGGRR